MKYEKNYLRKVFLLRRKKKYQKKNKFNFNLLFKLIKRQFHNKKITIGGYYPSYYEADVTNFLKEAIKKKFKIALPVLQTSSLMCFRSWNTKEPLYINKFGMLEPENKKKEIFPDIIIVPLVAFDNQLNRIGYGKGYYDRYLRKIQKIKSKAIFLGMAYYFQKCQNIPINKHDFKLDYIFTERGLISSKNKL